MKSFKFIILYLTCIILNACGGGGGGGSTDGGVNPTPPAPIIAAGINIGNVATIPLGHGGGHTTAIVTNNFSSQIVLNSATYTLYSSTGALAPQDATATNSPVNTSLCTIVQANGTCSLLLSAPAATQGQYLITLNYTNVGDGKTYTTSQLISYSTEVPINTNGIQVSTINNTLYNIPGGSTTYSVPFVLTQSVSSLSASTLYRNPAFASSISCDGNAPYPAGTQCTLFVKISQTGNAQVISENITVSTGTSLNIQSRMLTPNIKGTTGYLFNAPVTVVQNNIGNLITSAINLIANPASTPQTVTLLNNGAGTITGITINGNTPTVVGSNTCTSTLAIGASCSFTVSASITQNTQAAVIVNYTTGSTSNSVAFNVVYIVPASTAGMSMTPSGNLNNTVINTTSTLNISVTNTGTANLSNISFTAAAGLPTGMSYSGSSTCATDGSQSLNVGQSCTLVISYSPTVTSAGPSIIIREAASYFDPGLGTYQSYTAATATISYTAIASQAFVYISPNYVAYAIRADGSDTATQTFVIDNASPVSTTVTAESLANPPVTAYTTIGGTCSFPQTLTAAPSAGESCTVIARFGPTTSTISTTSQMTATYYTTGTNTAIAFANLSFTSSPAALISISSVTQTGATGGSGTSGSPYTFTNSPVESPITFTVTYQNTGTQNATTFSVALNTLPVGYYRTGGTCGSGASTSTLAASGDTCTAIFAAESTALYNSYSLNGSLNFNLPGWSYVDASTGLNTNTAPTFGSFAPTVYVTANALANAVESTPPNWTTAAAGGTNTLTFNVTGGTAATTTIQIESTGFAPSITYGVGSGTGAISGTCVVTGASGSCTIPVTNQSNVPITTYNFFFKVIPTGGGSTGIIKSGSFTYSS